MLVSRLGPLVFRAPRTCFRRVLDRNSTKVKFYSTGNTKPAASILKLGAIGVSVGAAVGTAYSLYSASGGKTDHKKHERKLPAVIGKRPDIKIAKRIISPTDKSGLDLVLFQFQTCPFCCKVRAFLDYHGLSYSIVEVDAVLRQDLRWSDYRKVPILLAKRKDGKYVQLTDSSAIVSVLASYLHDPSQDIGELANFYPTISFFDDSGAKKEEVMNKYFIMYQEKVPENLTGKTTRDERKWRSWADDELVHLISPNVYRTRKEAFETFEWFSEAGEWSVLFPQWERNMMVYIGAYAMWLISKRLKKKYGLTDDVRSHIYDSLGKLTSELKMRGTKYLGGDRPNLADLSIFGILCSMEGCSAFKECLQNTDIGPWFNGIKELTVKSKGHAVINEALLRNMQHNIT